jgi:hypothetical protein
MGFVPEISSLNTSQYRCFFMDPLFLLSEPWQLHDVSSTLWQLLILQSEALPFSQETNITSAMVRQINMAPLGRGGGYIPLRIAPACSGEV